MVRGQDPRPPGERDFNRYVERVDALLTPSMTFNDQVSNVAESYGALLLERVTVGGKTDYALLESLVEETTTDKDLRLDLYSLLIAFGCPGHVDVTEYLSKMSA